MTVEAAPMTWQERREAEFRALFDSMRSHPRYSDASMETGTFIRQPGYFVTIRNLVLPPGWNRRTATVCFFVSAYFPCAVPDGFWTLPNLWLDTGFRTEGGMPPRCTRLIRDPEYLPPGQTEALLWLWKPAQWSPNGDTLLTWARLIHQRFDLRHEVNIGGD